MLDFLERHKEGILGTIIIHLVLATVVLVLKINSIQNTEKAMEVNMLDEAQIQELLNPEENKENQIQNKEVFTPAEKAMLGVKNMATNEADKAASDRIDQMVNEIKGELNIKDPAPSQGNNTPQPSSSEDALPDKNAKEEKVNVTRSTTGVRTFYKGPTTVSYFLDGRYHDHLPIPVYKCQGNGKIVMKIEVNQQGYIIKTEIDKTQSEITDCHLEAAEKAARTTRFNTITSGPAVQKGTLTYIFIAQ